MGGRWELESRNERVGQDPKIQNCIGLNSEMGYFDLFKRSDLHLFVSGGKRRTVKARMRSTLALKMHIAFYQGRMVDLKSQHFKAHDINANHYHYFAIIQPWTVHVLCLLR